jgi:hypothetical protein
MPPIALVPGYPGRGVGLVAGGTEGPVRDCRTSLAWSLPVP